MSRAFVTAQSFGYCTMPMRALFLMASARLAHSQDAVAMLQGVTGARSQSGKMAFDADAEQEDWTSDGALTPAAIPDEKVQDTRHVRMMQVGQTGQWFNFLGGSYEDGFAAGKADEAAADGSYTAGFEAGEADQADVDRIEATVAREDQTVADEEVGEQRYAVGMADQAAADSVEEDIAKEIALAAGELFPPQDEEQDQMIPAAALMEDFSGRVPAATLMEDFSGQEAFAKDAGGAHGGLLGPGASCDAHGGLFGAGGFC